MRTDRTPPPIDLLRSKQARQVNAWSREDGGIDYLINHGGQHYMVSYGPDSGLSAKPVTGRDQIAMQSGNQAESLRRKNQATSTGRGRKVG